MPSTSGDFGAPNGPATCTATSKRSGQRCKMPAVKGSRTQKCRMHGGHASIGGESTGFVHGRHTRYLPAELDLLYQEALTHPDLLELNDYIALNESRINQILQAIDAEGGMPRWSQVAEVFGAFETAILSGDINEVGPALERWHEFMERGKKWDKAWDQINEHVELLRKLADTEIKRKRDLQHMIPVERVITLMAAVGASVKRNVSKPEEIEAVYRELEMMQTGNTNLEGTRRRYPNNQTLITHRLTGKVVDVAPQEG